MIAPSSTQTRPLDHLLSSHQVLISLLSVNELFNSNDVLLGEEGSCSHFCFSQVRITGMQNSTPALLCPPAFSSPESRVPMAATASSSSFLLTSKCWKRDGGQLAAVGTENILTVKNDVEKEENFKDLNKNTSCNLIHEAVPGSSVLVGENIFGMSGGTFALI